MFLPITPLFCLSVKKIKKEILKVVALTILPSQTKMSLRRGFSDNLNVTNVLLNFVFYLEIFSLNVELLLNNSFFYYDSFKFSF